MTPSAPLSRDALPPSRGARLLQRAVACNTRHTRKTRRVLRRAKALREVLQTLHQHRATLPPPHKAAVADLAQAVEKLAKWDAERAAQHRKLVGDVHAALLTLEDATTLVRCDRLARHNEVGSEKQKSQPKAADNQTCSGVRWLTEADLRLPLLCTPLMIQPTTAL